MGFGDLKSAAGLKALDDFLGDRSYIVGYTPTQADVVVFEALSGTPSSDLYNALRWYNHIASYASQKSGFPGEKKALSEYGPSAAATPAAANDDEDSDDDIDLFGSDEEEDDEDMQKKKQALVDAYNAKKGKKPALIAKSMIILDVKPWDDETDMALVEKKVRAIEKDGLVWGTSKLIAVGYGIKKLQISCVVEDAKVGTDFLEESICGFEDLVQSMDVAAFNKL
ncbi:unnamed protein product [Owenia fusiformis]|uniref:Elongation factor 1-beta n=1 Tax=Owenia fusiformis TaxID=6347 RepID=A0A8S4P711_OWEFU|nr:unnamed protein product [Owenia fusiformis]